MDNQENLPLPQNDLPEPQKLLKSPTFGEKYLSSKWYILALVTILVFLFGGSYFFGEAVIKTILPPTTTPTPVQSIATPTPDPISGWKTYTDNTLGISFMHPPDWEVVEDDGLIKIGPVNDLPRVYAGSFEGDKDQYFQENFVSEHTESTTQNAYTRSAFPATIYFVNYDDNAQAFGPSERTVIIFGISNNQNFFFDSYGKPDETFQQIVSTFKFIDNQTPATPQPTTTDDQVFCTMDAKLCPDGSSVGRQGPNCEFAPCP